MNVPHGGLVVPDDEEGGVVESSGREGEVKGRLGVGEDAEDSRKFPPPPPCPPPSETGSQTV